MSEFFAMNGYGFYVWSAYGVAALVLLVELVALRSRRRSVLAEARLTVPDGAADPRRSPNEAPSSPLRVDRRRRASCSPPRPGWC